MAGTVAQADPSVVDAATRQRVLDLAGAVHAETRGWDELLGRDGHAQAEAARREQAATRVRNYQDEVIPGLLQTPEYARAYFEIGRTTDVEAAVACIERQKVLRVAGRRFVFLIAERVLSWPVGGAEVLAEQRDRIVSLSRLPSVELAVLPTVPVAAVAWHNFTLWEHTGLGHMRSRSCCSGSRRRTTLATPNVPKHCGNACGPPPCTVTRQRT